MRKLAPTERTEAERILAKPRSDKREEELRFLRSAIDAEGSLPYAKSIALRYASRANSLFVSIAKEMPLSSHREFLESLIEYVVHRDR
jgi:geranylgeranyl pyrophosphate synthase